MHRNWKVFIFVSVLAAAMQLVLYLQWLDLSTAQYVFFPLLLLPFFILRVSDARIPGLVLILSAVAVLSGGFHEYRSYRTGNDNYLFSRLDHDEHQASTRIVRESINKRLESVTAVRLGRYHNVVSTPDKALEVLSSSPDLKALVWGDKRWLSITFARGSEHRELREFGIDPQFYNLAELSIATEVSTTGLSFKPLNETETFISYLIAGHDGIDRDYNVTEDAMNALLEARTIASLWTSFAHRAYPVWKLGNIHLIRGLGEDGDRADLMCAADYFHEAIGYLRMGDNTDLLAASMNNLALVLYALDIRSGELWPGKESLKYFDEAVSTIEHDNAFGKAGTHPELAAANLKLVSVAKRASSPEVRKKKLKKKKAERKLKKAKKQERRKKKLRNSEE